MSSPPRRVHARYPCRLSARILPPSSNKPLEGMILNIGIGGALIGLQGALNPGKLRLEILWENETIALDAKCVRSAGVFPKEPQPSRYGVEFIPNKRVAPRIQALVDKVRSSQGDKNPLLIDYWNP